MSSLVFPIHDPNRIHIKHLKQAFPILKSNFSKARVGFTPNSKGSKSEIIKLIKNNFFIECFDLPQNTLAGDHFKLTFEHALKHSKQDEVLHLCTLDRLLFAVLSDYRKVFLDDMKKCTSATCPVIYTRSEKAWSTHPINYRAAESMVTKAGEILFGKKFDFAWCHMAITAKQLKEIMPEITEHNWNFLIQMTMSLETSLKIKEVDWLSWEDPFILGRDSKKLKLEREKDPNELEKRLNYAIPQAEFLFDMYQKSKLNK